MVVRDPLIVVLYSAVVYENKPNWLEWVDVIKIPGVHTIDKLIEQKKAEAQR